MYSPLRVHHSNYAHLRSSMQYSYRILSFRVHRIWIVFLYGMDLQHLIIITHIIVFCIRFLCRCTFCICALSCAFCVLFRSKCICSTSHYHHSGKNHFQLSIFHFQPLPVCILGPHHILFYKIYYILFSGRLLPVITLTRTEDCITSKLSSRSSVSSLHSAY